MQWNRVGVVLLILSGCGTGAKGPKLPPTVPVMGVVKVNGVPLPKATVTFVPVGVTKGTGAQATTDESGKYEASAIHGEKGAPLGTYRVAISKLVLPDGSEIPPDSKEAPITLNARDLLPAEYSSLEYSTLKANVPPGGGAIDFDIPAGWSNGNTSIPSR